MKTGNVVTYLKKGRAHPFSQFFSFLHCLIVFIIAFFHKKITFSRDYFLTFLRAGIMVTVRIAEIIISAMELVEMTDASKS